MHRGDSFRDADAGEVAVRERRTGLAPSWSVRTARPTPTGARPTGDKGVGGNGNPRVIVPLFLLLL